MEEGAGSWVRTKLGANCNVRCAPANTQSENTRRRRERDGKRETEKAEEEKTEKERRTTKSPTRDNHSLATDS